MGADEHLGGGADRACCSSRACSARSRRRRGSSAILRHVGIGWLALGVERDRCSARCQLFVQRDIETGSSGRPRSSPTRSTTSRSTAARRSACSRASGSTNTIGGGLIDHVRLRQAGAPGTSAQPCQRWTPCAGAANCRPQRLAQHLPAQQLVGRSRCLPPPAVGLHRAAAATKRSTTSAKAASS